MSITAMVTAVAAVIVAIIQTQVMHDEAQMEREHARLSVLPSIQVYTHIHSSSTDSKFYLALVNQGIGPAVIEGFRVKLDGTPVHTWESLVSGGTDGKLHIDGDERNISTVITSDIDQGVLLPVGERLAPIQLEAKDNIGDQLRDLGDKMDVSICYCSLFKECWVTGLKEARPKPVNSCKAYDGQFFRNEG